MSKEKTGQRHKNKIYFKDQDLDLYLQAFPLNFQTYGGATRGEAFYAASRINEKDQAQRLGYRRDPRSEEHTSELQSRQYLVCRLLLEKKKNLSLVAESVL